MRLRTSARQVAAALVVLFVAASLLPGVLAGGGDDPGGGPCPEGQLCESTALEPTPPMTRLNWFVLVMGLVIGTLIVGRWQL